MTTIINGQTRHIDDKTLDRMIKNIPCTKDEAIQIYAEDEGWIDNSVTKEMSENVEKTKAVLRTVHQAISQKVVDKKMNGEATRGTGKKAKDESKIEIINGLAEYLTNNYENVIIENAGKIITFTVNGEKYKLDLTKTRVPKK